MLKQDERRPLEREPILNTPALVSWIIGLLSGVFLVQSLLPEDARWTLVASFGVVPGRYFDLAGVPGSLLPGAWARLVPLLTYGLLHGSAAHLFLNVAWLLAIGTPVAQRLGTARFLLFCTVTGIAAAVFYILIKSDSTAPMIGASGAISGLFGGLARFLFAGAPGARSVRFTDRRVLFFAVTWLALNMVLGLTGLGTEGGASTIAWQAHAGGFIAGLALFPLFERAPRAL